jgi:acetyltransferase-like isoleucine patch superfamily enzyme
MTGKMLRYFASMLPMPLGLRAWVYKLSGVNVGAQVSIDRNVHLTRPSEIWIGDRVTISTGVSLLGEVTAVHSRLESEFGVHKTGPVVIADDVYIGVKATILPGVSVGRMATVGANTLVTSDVPPYGVVLGVPGRVMMVRQRPDGAA